MYIDQVMVGKIMGDAAAGLYGASFRIIEASLFVPVIGFDDERWIAGALFTLALVNVSANSFMIPSIDIVGAAIATVGCEVLLFGAYFFRIRRMLGTVPDDQWISRG